MELERDLLDVSIRARGIAGDFFDALVTEQLDTTQPDHVVEIVWNDIGDDDAGIPAVVIDGVDSAILVEYLMRSRYIADLTLIEATQTEVTEQIATMWENTLEYYRELDDLSPIMDALAISQTTGYQDKARDIYSAQGVPNPAQADIVSRARELACAAFEQYRDDVDANNEAYRLMMEGIGLS